MQKMKNKTKYLFLIVATLLILQTGSLTAHAAGIPSIEYTLYNVNKGKSTGKDWTAAGDTSQNRSEKNDYWNAISMNITNKGNLSGGIQYAIHVHDVGWSNDYNSGGVWYKDGKKLFYDTVNGFTTPYPWIEAVSAVLYGELKDYYYINYNARISPLSLNFKNSPDVVVDEKRYNRGVEFFEGDAKKTSYWTGFDEDLSKVLGDGYNEEGLANDGGLNFAGTWGMAMPISAFRAQLLPYQVKVTIDPNGGTYSGSTSDNISWPQADTLKSIATPRRTGYRFTGWTMTQSNIKDSKESLKKNKQQYPDNNRAATWKTKNKELQLGNKNVTLKANWEKASYTLTVKPNGGTWKGKTTDQSFTLKYGETMTIEDPTRKGYDFDWTRTGAGSSLKGKTFTMGTANATLTADWTIKSYTLTVKPNGGTWKGKTADQPFTLKYKETMSIEDPVRKGYQFNWTKTGAGSSLSGKTFTMGTANATLTANWKPNAYTIVYNGNGATGGSTANQTATYDMELPLQKNGFVRPGYTFTGWNTAANASGTSYRESQKVKNLTTTANGTVTLYAQWRANTYTLVFDGNGATEGSMEGISATVDALPIQLPANQFKRTTEQGESKFMGWALVPEPENRKTEFKDQGQMDKNLSLKEGDTVTLYAIWDDCPMIEASDRYFNLYWAQNGKITEEELLRTAKATDKEDIELENRTSEQLAVQGLPGSLSLFNYSPEKFLSMQEEGTVSLTYQAVDSAGNTVYETITVYVYDTAAIPLEEKYTRYINKKYYEKSYEEGGLHPDSKWRTDPEYKAALEEALENEENDTPIATYYFTNDEVKEAQDYVTEHGIANTKEPNALQRFFDLFMR